MCALLAQMPQTAQMAQRGRCMQQLEMPYWFQRAVIDADADVDADGGADGGADGADDTESDDEGNLEPTVETVLKRAIKYQNMLTRYTAERKRRNSSKVRPGPTHTPHPKPRVL